MPSCTVKSRLPIRLDKVHAKIRWRLHALRQLQGISDIQLFCQITLIALIAPYLANRHLLTGFIHHARSRHQRPPLSATQRMHLVALTDLALRVGQPLVQRRCLVRSLTLYYLLQRAGVAAELHIGIADATHGYAAHSWIVVDDEPIAEAVDPRPHFPFIQQIA